MMKNILFGLRITLAAMLLAVWGPRPCLAMAVDRLLIRYTFTTYMDNREKGDFVLLNLVEGDGSVIAGIKFRITDTQVSASLSRMDIFREKLMGESGLSRDSIKRVQNSLGIKETGAWGNTTWKALASYKMNGYGGTIGIGGKKLGVIDAQKNTLSMTARKALNALENPGDHPRLMPPKLVWEILNTSSFSLPRAMEPENINESADDTRALAVSLASENTDLSLENKTLSTKNSELSQIIIELKKQYEFLKTENAALKTQAKDAWAQVDHQDAEASRLKSQIEKLEKSLAGMPTQPGYGKGHSGDDQLLVFILILLTGVAGFIFFLVRERSSRKRHEEVQALQKKIMVQTSLLDPSAFQKAMKPGFDNLANRILELKGQGTEPGQEHLDAILSALEDLPKARDLGSLEQRIAQSVSSYMVLEKMIQTLKNDLQNRQEGLDLGAIEPMVQRAAQESFGTGFHDISQKMENISSRVNAVEKVLEDDALMILTELLNRIDLARKEIGKFKQSTDFAGKP